MKKQWPREEIRARTMTRRTVLEWLGKAAVIPLGAEAWAACTRTPAGVPADAAGADAVPSDTGSEVNPDAPDGSLPFEPSGEHELYSSWPERTVDRQELEEILSTWTMRIDGLVEEPLTLDFAELTGLTRQDQLMDVHCVEGWSVYDVPWNGIHLSTLFELVRPLESATHVTFHTMGERYNESLPLSIALEPHTILGYGVGGSTLPVAHGFPARVVVPRMFGYKSAKYVTRIELDDEAVEGFWVAYGYPYLGEVPESRLRPGRY
ncbi:MAG: molybdopterin-dependent oxidoreductase [Deltaproteobacteria bacterium]|nr:molybdopterin-dependent oxidoreductase [Deltaproteobacteria bacterium]